jgi:two-component system OmpR family response regulator
MEPVRRAVVIEDDDDIRHLLETVLNQAGFEVTARSNGYDGIEAVRLTAPTVVTLDVNMPGIDGFETAKRIRAFSDAYIVMLTALGEEIDTLQGLEAGADDYVTKPFRPRELRARIEAMLRRPRAAATPAPSIPVPGAPRPPEAPAYTAVAPGAHAAPPSAGVPGERLEHLGLVVDLGTRVAIADGQEIPLTRSEFDLLAALLQSGRRVRTKADLAILLRNESYVTSNFVSDADKRGIEVHMGNLRKKIGENSLTPRWIETVRGVGYRLTGADTGPDGF